jgi:hypothetical protein
MHYRPPCWFAKDCSSWCPTSYTAWCSIPDLRVKMMTLCMWSWKL